MNLDTIVPTLDNCSSTLPVSCNIESSNEKIYVTLINYDGSVFTNLEIEPGKTVTLPIPTREGYRFVGWSLTKGGSDLFDFSTPIVDDITLYSVWRDRSLVHVSFYDGQKLIKDGYYKSGEKHRFPSVDYLGEEFTVYGWIKEGDSKIVTGSFFELLYSEEEINFKVYITTYFLSIDMNGVIEMTDYLKLETEVYHHFNIPNSLNGIPVTSIGGESFKKSYFLSRITIPDSVTSIGRDAFSECANLSQIDVSENNKCYKSIDGVLFDRTGKTIICYPNGKTESEYSIPESVTAIGDRAFYECKGLTSINIPNSVTAIGDRAFEGCSGLTSINIPDSVTSIGERAFDFCYGFSGRTSINIPDSVTSIGDWAFYGFSGRTCINISDSITSIGDSAFNKCAILSQINVSENNKCYKSIDGVLFDRTGKTIICYPKGKTESEYSIPESVTSIGDSAFYGCSYLTSINIPNSVITIGDSAFYGCYGYFGLTSINIPNSVTAIGDRAFYGCKGLTSINIPDSVTSIGDSAFDGCSGLTSINIPDSVTSIGDKAFSWCESLTRIVIPDSVTSIGDSAFNKCDSLIEIDVSENNKCYKSIDGVLFDRTGKTIICYPKGKTESEYSIPESVTSIGNSAFYYCSGLTSINIPNSVTSIGDEAFSWCKSLTSIVIPDSVTSIGDRAFIGCSGLTCINIPDSVTSIGDSAFYDCSGLTSIDIPNSVTSIGDGAFFGCKGLTSINIPDSVTSIGDGAFFGCKGLTSINIPDSVTSIGNRSFSRCKSLTSIVIPDSVTAIGDEAFSWCESLTSIVIPDSVTSIGRYAFEACEKLSEIHINKTINSIPYAPWRGNIMIDEEANDVLKDVDIIWSDETVSYYNFSRHREFYD